MRSRKAMGHVDLKTFLEQAKTFEVCQNVEDLRIIRA